MKDLIHTITSLLGGFVAYLVGGFGSLFIGLVVLCFIDWLLGGLKAGKNHTFSYTLFLWGFVNKLVVVIIIIGVNFIQLAMNLPFPARESVIMLLLINESLSMLRNASAFVKGLEPITVIFENVKLNILKIFKVGD